MSKKAPRKEIEPTHPLKRWLLFGALLVVILVPVFFGALGLYHVGKIWRARSLAREGTALLNDQQSVADAEDRLMAAYHLAPYDADVLRACANFSQSQGDAMAMVFYQQLLTLPNSTREDRRAALRTYLLFDKIQAAAGLAANLTADNPETDDWVCEAQVLWQENQPSAAIGLMRKALAAAPDNRNYQFFLAQMLASLSDDKGQLEALTTFRKLAQGKDEASLLSLIAMSHATGLDKASLRTILKQLNEHPLKSDESRFAAWQLESLLGDRAPKVVLQGVVDYYKTSDLFHKSKAARWLYGHTQPELALKLATLTDSIESKDLFLVRLDSLAYMGDWPEVAKELTDTHAPISPTLVFLYRARAAKEMGDPVGSKTDWERARSAATAEPGMLTYLANYALQTNAFDEAEKTFVQMTKSPTEAEEGYTALVKLQAQHGSALDLLDALRQMTEALPEKPESKNDWAYLSLLLDKDVEKAAKAAHELVTAHPEMLAYRSTLALAYFRQSDFSGAAKVYQGQQIDWQAAPASWKMVYAVVMSASGNISGAQSFATTIDRSQLRPEERALLNTWLPGI